MKTSSSLIITLSFLFWFSFTTTKPSLASAEEALDNDGQPLVPGEQYYILSAIIGPGGGGIRPARIGDSSSQCSYSVIQATSDLNRGDPVKFSVQGTSTDTISVAFTFLEIEFVNKPKCADSSKWASAYNESRSSFPWLVIGGPKDHPESQVVSGVFKIEKQSLYFYKLVFCASPFRCFDVGRESRDGYRFLVLNNDAFPVVFVKAKDYESGKSVIRMRSE